MFREAFRRFVETEITPNHTGWKLTNTSVEGLAEGWWAGFLCPTMPEGMYER